MRAGEHGQNDPTVRAVPESNASATGHADHAARWRDILLHTPSRITRREGGLDDGVDPAQRRNILRDATAESTRPSAATDDGVGAERLRSTLRRATAEFTRDGRESDGWTDPAWFDRAVAWARTQYECRQAARVDTAEYVAAIGHAIPPDDARRREKFARRLVGDALGSRFAWDAASLLAEGHCRTEPTFSPTLEAWRRRVWRRTHRGRAPGRPGAGEQAYFFVELDVWEIVETLVDRHDMIPALAGRRRVTATRNPGARVVRRSACHVLSEALGMGYHTVASIRTRHGNSPVRKYRGFLPRRGAPGTSPWEIRTTAELPADPGDAP